MNMPNFGGAFAPQQSQNPMQSRPIGSGQPLMGQMQGGLGALQPQQNPMQSNPMAQQQMQSQYQAFMNQQNGRPDNAPMNPMQSNPMQQPMQAQNPMQQMGGPQPSQQEREYAQQMNAASQNMLKQYGGDQGNPAFQAAMRAQDQQMRSQFGLPQSVAAQPGSLTAGPGSMQNPMQGNMPMGGGMQPSPPPMQNYQQRLGGMPQAPTTMQMGQEPARMQAMRNMNQMNFGNR